MKEVYRVRKVKPRRNRGYHVLLILGGLIATLGLGCSGNGNGDRKSSKPFDAQVWREGNVRARGTMARNLIAKKDKILLGQKKSDVRALLGPPDETLDNKWEYKVDLGQEFVGSPWMYKVDIFFTEDEKVKDVWLMD